MKSLRKIRVEAQNLLLGLLGLIAFMPAGAAERVTYFVSDHLGSPVAAVDEQGAVLWRESYAPYGERRIRANENEARAAYTGKSEDQSIDLVYMGARWHDPVTGRFLGVDPQGFDVGYVQSFSRYSYANNRPYVYVDPDGEWASKAGFYVHQRATYRAIGKNISRADNAILAKAQVYADGDQFQGGASSYRHAMSGPGQTVEEARERANEFVRSQFERAWAAKDREDALFEFGIALHTLQDATSPSHEGFQRWTGHETRGEQIGHGRRELIDPGPGSRLHEVTRRAWEWFNERSLPKGDLFNNQMK